MKRGYLAGMVVAGAVALTMALGGCSEPEAATSQAANEPAAEEQAQTEDAQKKAPAATTQQPMDDDIDDDDDAYDDDVDDADDVDDVDDDDRATSSGAAASADFKLSEDEAKQIALRDAGVSEADTVRLTVRTDIDDGVARYEVEFVVGTDEYDYDIDAQTGDIIERNVEPEVD